MVKQPFNSGDTPESAKTNWDLLIEGQSALDAVSASPRLDSELLLRAALGVCQSGLILAFRDSCPEPAREIFCEFIKRRQSGEPVAYILGEREFWGLSFEVNKDVLVPRPETELVVEEALKKIRGTSKVKVLDLGTGSGCIAISIVSELLKRGVSDLSCDALDISNLALEVAKRNAKRHGVFDQIKFICGSWFDIELNEQYDLIVANPPYVDPAEKTPIDLSFEPRSALYSDENGLADTKQILKLMVPRLKKSGLFLCEIGAGKRAFLSELLQPYNKDFEINYLGDDSSQDRFCVLQMVWRG